MVDETDMARRIRSALPLDRIDGAQFYCEPKTKEGENALAEGGELMKDIMSEFTHVGQCIERQGVTITYLGTYDTEKGGWVDERPNRDEGDSPTKS